MNRRKHKHEIGFLQFFCRQIYFLLSDWPTLLLGGTRYHFYGPLPSLFSAKQVPPLADAIGAVAELAQSEGAPHGKHRSQGGPVLIIGLTLLQVSPQLDKEVVK